MHETDIAPDCGDGLLAVMKVAGRRKAALHSVMAGMFDGCSYAANEQSKIEATITPTMFMMDAAEFAQFKEDTRHLGVAARAAEAAVVGQKADGDRHPEEAPGRRL